MSFMLGVDDFKAKISSSGGMARSNLYMVELPSMPGTDFAPYDLNIICKSTQLPGRQILTHERQIGSEKSYVAYGHAVEDITLTFHVMNDYKIKKYFEKWQDLAITNNAYEIGYFNEYAKTISVKQLRRGISIPIWKNTLDFLNKVPSNILNRLPSIGPIDLSQGEIDLAIVTGELIMYDCRLVGAFPTSITSIDMADANVNGLVELTVSLSYTNWYNRDTENSSVISQILAKFGIF